MPRYIFENIKNIFQHHPIPPYTELKPASSNSSWKMSHGIWQVRIIDASSGTGGREMKWWKEKLEILKTINANSSWPGFTVLFYVGGNKTFKSLAPPNPWKVAKVQRVEKRAQTADCWPLLSLFSVSCRNSAMRGCCLSGWPSTGACTSLIHWTSVRTPARL